jgi:hypothetical protein
MTQQRSGLRPDARRRAIAGIAASLCAGLAMAHHSGFQVQDARKKLDEALTKSVGEAVWVGGVAIGAPYVTRTRVVEMREPEIMPLESNVLPLELFAQDALLPNCTGARREFSVQFALSGLQGEYATITKGVQVHQPSKASLALSFPAAHAGTVSGDGEMARRVAIPSAEAQTHDWTRVLTRQQSVSFTVPSGKALIVRAYVAQWERLFRFRGRAVLDAELAAPLAAAKGKRAASDLLGDKERSLEILGQLKSFHLSELVITQLERDLASGDCESNQPKPEVTRLRLEAVPGFASLGTWSFMLRDPKGAEPIAPLDLKRVPGGGYAFRGVGPGMVCFISACGEPQAGSRRIVRTGDGQACTLAQTVPDPACGAAVK